MTREFNFDRATILAALLLAVVTLAIFAPVISYQFINVDDNAYVVANEHVRQGLSLHNAWWALTALEAANWHPVTWLSHLMDVSLFGMNPHGHHATSLVIHVLNVLLLFFWLRSATGAVWKSAFVAAVFAVHPLALESVAWIAERKNVLSTFFLLLTLLAYLWYVSKPRVGRYLLVALALALGLMAKPMLVTVPFVLLLLDYWPLDRLTRASTSRNDGETALSPSKIFFLRCLEKAPLLILAVASSVLTVKAQALDSEIKVVPFMSRLANAEFSYGVYLKQMLWPDQLAIFYPFRYFGFSAWQSAGSLLLVCVISVLVEWQIRKRPYLAVGWFWYLGTLIPVIGLVHVGDLSHADRYTYVPLLGILIAITWGLAELGTRVPNLRYGLIGAGTIAVLALAIKTTRDISYWRDGVSISEHAIAVTGSNCLMERTLGETLYAQGRVDEAVDHLTRSVQDQPTDAALYDLGTIDLQQNKVAEAAAYFLQALQYPGEARMLGQIHNNLAVIEMQQGAFADAEAHFKESIRLDPSSARHRVAFGWMLSKEARYEEAASQFEEAVKSAPDAMAYFYLGSALEQEHKFDQATEAYRKTLVLAPNLQEAQARLNAMAALRQ
ncbi:MAG: tetratricopeptide repeat protein [Candidatus Sulfotelmatobacter sp.]